MSIDKDWSQNKSVRFSFAKTVHFYFAIVLIVTVSKVLSFETVAEGGSQQPHPPQQKTRRTMIISQMILLLSKRLQRQLLFINNSSKNGF